MLISLEAALCHGYTDASAKLALKPTSIVAVGLGQLWNGLAVGLQQSMQQSRCSQLSVTLTHTTSEDQIDTLNVQLQLVRYDLHGEQQRTT